jgi:hypothetical protein
MLTRSFFFVLNWQWKYFLKFKIIYLSLWENTVTKTSLIRTLLSVQFCLNNVRRQLTHCQTKYLTSGFCISLALISSGCFRLRCLRYESIFMYSSGHPFIPQITLKFGCDACCIAIWLTNAPNVRAESTKERLHDHIFAIFQIPSVHLRQVSVRPCKLAICRKAFVRNSC